MDGECGMTEKDEREVSRSVGEGADTPAAKGERVGKTRVEFLN